MEKKNKIFKGVKEQKGVSYQEITNKNAVEKLKQKRQIKRTVDELFKGITSGDTTSLSQGITLIESTKANYQTLDFSKTESNPIRCPDSVIAEQMLSLIHI